MIEVELVFNYEIDRDDPDEAVELATELLIDWLQDGNTPEIGVNAEVHNG